MATVHDFTVRSIDGRQVSLSEYEGCVLLIVNVASKCGFTPQYAGLEALYRELRADGFKVLGFPCDQFGHQEPGSEAEIQQFCSLSYDVSFPMFAKIAVNGVDADPLYQHLKGEASGVLGTRSIKWNFTKFLVDREGRVLRRYAPTDSPARTRGDVIAALS